jgi:hypothetical protein
MRNDGRVKQDLFRRIQRDLDLDEARWAPRSYARASQPEARRHPFHEGHRSE